MISWYIKLHPSNNRCTFWQKGQPWYSWSMLCVRSPHCVQIIERIISSQNSARVLIFEEHWTSRVHPRSKYWNEKVYIYCETLTSVVEYLPFSWCRYKEIDASITDAIESAGQFNSGTRIGIHSTLCGDVRDTFRCHYNQQAYQVWHLLLMILQCQECCWTLCL